LHLDFGNIETLSAAMLGLLVALHIELRSLGRGLVLFNLSARIYEIFQAMELTQLLDIRPAGLQLQLMHEK
jgi:anti-anti-sigma regulatory factor